MQQKLEIRQTYALSRKLIQSAKILQMGMADLDRYLETVASDNPVIEISYSGGSAPLYSSGKEETEFYDLSEDQVTLKDHVLSQFTRELSSTERMILVYILDSLEPDGYYRETVRTGSAVLNVSEESFRKILKEVQSKDPAGIAAHDLKECLLIQAEREYGIADLEELIRNHLEDVARGHLRKIAEELELEMEEVMDLCDLLRSLDPHPGSAFRSPEKTTTVIPDVTVTQTPDGLKASLNERYTVRVSVNEHYLRLLETADPQTREYLEKKIQGAKRVKECLEKRNETLLKISGFILEKQKGFLTGEGQRGRVRMKEAAETLDLHPSTVTRAVRDKYLEGPQGIVPLRSFFSDAGTGEYSRDMIGAAIRKIIEKEDPDHPLSDQGIRDLLAEEGIEVSRRLVCKQRRLMGIMDSEGRKRL